ncbi:hypothetical protein D3C72_1886490 [compost metagenome]
MRAQQDFAAGREVDIQLERVAALQVAPARDQAGVELVADGVGGGPIRRAAVVQGIGLAHQFDGPGVGGHALGQQLRLIPLAPLAAVQGQALQVGLLAQLQLPEAFPFVQGQPAQHGKEQRQGEAAEADYPADRRGFFLAVH